MQVKIYLPKVIEIPSEYLPALASRAADNLEQSGEEVFATRGHLVRQAVRDGLLREFDDLISDDGAVDIFCDPENEIPLGVDNHSMSLQELVESLQNKQTLPTGKSAAA
jgi:hypothetical protein